jgi:CsoR family transcriptional regulator, copper-sensing transcriptional repressor
MAQHKRKQVSLRVRRIHGHVHAIAKMLDEGRPYPEIVHQVVAVRAALDGVIQVIVDDLVEDCVARTASKEPIQDTVLELKEVVGELR